MAVTFHGDIIQQEEEFLVRVYACKNIPMVVATFPNLADALEYAEELSEAHGEYQDAVMRGHVH